MDLKELKKMIAEEYTAFKNEQAEPAVDVAPGDVDVDGDENPEETLRQIYDMLKDYFEGDDADADDAGADDADAGDDEPAGAAPNPADTDGDGDVDADDALQEAADIARFKKLANIIKG